MTTTTVTMSTAFAVPFICLPPLKKPRAQVATVKALRTNRLSPRAHLRLADKTVLVTGATGPTGRLICAALSERGARVRALVRPRTYINDRRRVDAVREICPSVQYVIGDLRDHDSIRGAVLGAHAVVSAAGSRSFEGSDPNRPEIVEFHAVRNLVRSFVHAQIETELAEMMVGEVGGALSIGAGSVKEAELHDASRFVLVSSLGVTRPERFPQLMQMGSLLRYKLCGEDAVRESGCPYTVVRPGGFVDVPADHAGVILDQGDRLAGSLSRADVAEICADAVLRPSATNVTFECVGGFATEQKRRFSPQMFDGLVRDDV